MYTIKQYNIQVYILLVNKCNTSKLHIINKSKARNIYDVKSTSVIQCQLQLFVHYNCSNW